MTRKTTILRKSVSSVPYMEIVDAYAKGESTVKQIAQEYQTSEENIGLIVTRFWKSLTNMKESRALITPSISSHHSLKQLHSTHLINPQFLELLSDPSTHLLTEAESTYCWIYVHTGNAREAIESAKLNKGLFKEKKKSSRFTYDKAIMIRSYYLNSKENVASYIKELREKRLIDADVGKAKIQSELLDQLAFMKSSGDPKYRRDILRSIELLGKTVGAFTERVEITQVNASDALDELIEMAKEASVKEITV